MRILQGAIRHPRLALIAPVIALGLIAASLGVAGAAAPASPQTTVTQGGTATLPLCQVCGPGNVVVSVASKYCRDVTCTLHLELKNMGADANSVTVTFTGYGAIPANLSFASLAAHASQSADVDVLCSHPIGATVAVGGQVVSSASLFSGTC